MARKGMTTVIAAGFIAVFVVLLITSVGLTDRWGTGLRDRRDLQTGFYTPLKGLEAARGYVAQTVRYAEYQACQELSAQGGQRTFEDGIVAGGERLSVLASREAFLESLGSAMTEQVRAATREPFGFLERTVAFPAYTVTVADRQGAQVVTARADKRLSVSGSKDELAYTLEKDGDVSLERAVHCLALHQQAEGIAGTVAAQTKAAVQSALQTQLSAGLPAPGTVVKIPGVAVAAFRPEDPALGALAVRTESGKELSVFQEGYRAAVLKAIALPEGPGARTANVADGGLALDHSCSLVPDEGGTIGTAHCTLHYTAIAVAKVTVSEPARAFPVLVGSVVVQAAPVLVFAVPASVDTRAVA